MELFIILMVVVIIIALIKNKTHLDIPSFFHKTLPLKMGKFGVYCFTGKQGTGKTYSLNKFIRKHAKGKKVYSNVTLKNYDYEPLRSIEHLLSLRDAKNVYIVFDEIFTFISKTRKTNSNVAKDLEEFLTQMRKMENIFITTAQEWLELPVDFRRYVRIQVDCKTKPLGFLGGILIESYYDATGMKWSQQDNEYVAPLITTKISKYEKRFMVSYDTFERIKPLPLYEQQSGGNWK